MGRIICAVLTAETHSNKCRQSTDHDVFGPRRTDTFPALWDGERLTPRRLSPAYLGEHNFEVWTEVGGLDPAIVAEGIGSGLFT